MSTNYLTNNLVYLSDHMINLSRILTHLQQEEILSASEREEILNGATSFEKNNRLLAFLQKKDSVRVQSVFISTLHETSNSHCVNVIQKKVPSNSTIWLDLQTPTRFYAGRDDEKEKLSEFWLTECKEGKILFFVAITGIGGVGKTELAKVYGEKFREDTQGHVLWINSETSQSRFNSFSKLATKLELSLKSDSGNEKSLDKLTMDVYEELKNDKHNKSCLIILDNVCQDDDNCFDLLIEAFQELTPPKKKPFVIFTSRYVPTKDALGEWCEQVQLDMLPVHDSEWLLREALKVKESNIQVVNLITTLCNRLGNFPLALQQAIAFIKKYPLVQVAIKKYMEMIDTETKKGLNYSLPRLQQYGKSSETTYTIWKVTLNAIKNNLEFGELAENIVNVISFCSSDIRTKFLSKLVLGMENDETFYLLNDYSMIKIYYSESEESQMISVHRLVQEVTQIYMQESEQLLNTLDNLLNLVVTFLKNDNERISISMSDMANLTTIWEHAAKENSLVEKYAKIPVLMLLAYDVNGYYRMGYEFCLHSVEVLTKVVGEDNPWTLKIIHWKGIMLEHLGKSEEALEVLNTAYETQENYLGEQHDDTLWTAGQIGNVYWRLSNFNEAKRWLAKAVTIRAAKFGKDHEGTLGLQNSIGLVLTDEGKCREAEELYLQILETCKGDPKWKDHTLILSAKHNLGSALYAQGKFQEAKTVWQDVLETREQVLGKKHPKTMITKFRVADVLEKEGNYEDAAKLFQQVFEVRESTLGKDHFITLKTKQRLELLNTKITVP